MRKMKFLVLAVMGLLCSMSVRAHDFKVGGIYYKITSQADKTVSVTYQGDYFYSYSNEYSGEVKIPESVTYRGNTYSVTSIGESAFDECSSLTSVEIPNSVTSIDFGVFWGCQSLTSVELPNSVTSIGDVAFQSCSSLTSVELPNSVTSIGNGAFSGCSSLTSVELPNSVTSIGDYAFQSCSSLTSVELPNSVTSIGDDAFKYCSSLTSVELPNSVTSIGDGAFSNCSGLCSMTIGTGVLSIGSNQCTPKKVIWLTNTPPSGWSNLKGTINYVANTQYGSSSNVKVYQYLSSLFESDGVKYVPVSPSERTCDAIDCSYDSSVETINIGETVSYRGIAMTVLNVMPYMAYGQTSVKNVSISHKGSISDYAFTGCTGITNATIANEGSIGASAFQGCVSLTAMQIPANVTQIGNYVFDNCTKLANVIIADRTTDLTLGSNGSSPLFSDCPLDSVYIGGNISYNTLSSYGYSPFYRNTSLRAVVISDDVKNIGNWAFSGCSNLDYFSFGKSVETIGQEAFSGCVNLKKLISYAEVPPTCGSMALDDINKWECALQVPESCLAAYQQADQWKEFFFIEDVLTAIGGVTVDGAVPATADVYSTNGMLVKRNADLKNLIHELPAGVYIIGGKKVYVR